jgi:hypothetical protein
LAPSSLEPGAEISADDALVPRVVDAHSLGLSHAALQRAQAFNADRRLLLGELGEPFAGANEPPAAPPDAASEQPPVARASAATAAAVSEPGDVCPPIWYGSGKCVDRMPQE